jgi:hypothetical protein
MLKSSLILRIIRHGCCLLGLSALALLSGCSTIQIAYNQADELAYWWLDGYVDLTDKQKPFVKDTLRHLHQWHRQSQLPEYLVFLQKLRALAPYDIQAEQACSVLQEVQSGFVGLVRHVEPEATQLVTQLSATHLNNVRKKYDKLNQEWREDYMDVSEEKRLRYRNKQLLSRLEDFYGSLDTLQKETVKQWIAKSSFHPATSYEDRLRRQNDALQTFHRIIQSGASNAASQAMLRGWMDRSLLPPDETLQKYSQILKQENCEGFAKLHNSTSRAQRERLAENLRSYETIFYNLSLKK